MRPASEVVRHRLLGDEVGVPVVADVARGVGEHLRVGARGQAAQPWHADLDDEVATRREVGGSVDEARHLGVLGLTFPIVLNTR